MKDKKEKDEFSFDFGSIKKFFNKPKKDKKKGSERKEEEQKEENEDKEISIDSAVIRNFFVKYNKVIIPVILIIFCMFFSAYFRMYSANLPITDEWAQNSVYNFYRENIRTQINQQYPNLPDTNKNVLVEQQFQEFLKTNKATVEGQIAQTSQQFKNQFKDADGRTYLLAIDPYYYFRQTRNLLEKGTVGDEIRNGTPWNTHMLAPLGRRINANFHHYFTLYTYKIMHFFNGNMSLMGAMFYVPIILSMLAVIPAFMIARKIGGNVGGFFAGFIVAVNAAFINRTAGGFSDTDAYNVLFPLLIAWLFLEAFEAKDTKKTIIYGALAAFAVGVFSIAWDAGWWYIFDFILIVIIAYIFYYIIQHRENIVNIKKYIKNPEIKKALILLAVFFVLSGVFVSAFYKGNVKPFTVFYSSPFSFMSIKQATHLNLWPNVYTTVAELNEASVPQIISTIGGSLLFTISLVGIILTLLSKKSKNLFFVMGATAWFIVLILMHKSIASLNVFLVLLAIPIIIRIVMALYKKEEGIDIKYAFFLILWYLGTIYASTKGVRFVLLLVPGFGVAFGIGIGKIYELISERAPKVIGINKTIVNVITLILLLILLYNPLVSADNAARNEIPSMNDGWYQSLSKIREESAPNAIINSWWDFGHWFKAIADRAVTFDGASQNRPQAHWIGKVLLTDDEELAIGILRMLDCGGNTAYDKLQKETGRIVKSVDILYEILPESEAKARTLLKKYVSEDLAEEVLKVTHCDPPEDYFITSQDMVSKSGVWAHFGSWDFDRAKMWNNSKTMNQEKFVKFMKDEFEYKEADAVSIYYQLKALPDDREANNWIAPWPGYSDYVDCSKQYDAVNMKTLIKCQNGIAIQLNEKQVVIPTDAGVKSPYSLGYMTTDGFELKLFENNTIEGLSINLIQDAALNYHILMLSPEVAGSMFTRLFYYEGVGLKHFEKFSDLRDVTGSRIIVWKVNWEGK